MKRTWYVPFELLLAFAYIMYECVCVCVCVCVRARAAIRSIVMVVLVMAMNWLIGTELLNIVWRIFMLQRVKRALSIKVELII